MNVFYLAEPCFNIATRSKENPARPVTKRRQCQRHQEFRRAIQLEGKESLVQVMTMALIGIFKNRVIKPEAAKHATVAMSNQKLQQLVQMMAGAMGAMMGGGMGGP